MTEQAAERLMALEETMTDTLPAMERAMDARRAETARRRPYSRIERDRDLDRIALFKDKQFVVLQALADAWKQKEAEDVKTRMVSRGITMAGYEE